MKYLFYCKGSDSIEGTTLTIDNRYSFCLWKPTVRSVEPRGLPKMPFVVWWVMHYLHVFTNRDYAMFVVYYGDVLVHRSSVSPGYFRFPFMAKDDLQIGDTWTAPEHRGKGLATFALQKTLELQKKLGRRFWYVVAESNIPSIRAAEKAGLIKVGEGIRSRRFGTRVFGSYVIQTHCPGSPNLE